MHFCCLLNLPQNHINTQRAAALFRVKEGVNGRQAMLEYIYHAHRQQIFTTVKAVEAG